LATIADAPARSVLYRKEFSMKSFVASLIVCGLLAVLPSVASAQIRGAGSKSLGQDYHFYTGSHYSRHAADHSQLLSYYTDAEQPVPAEVAKTHTAEIRKNVEASRRSYSTLKKATADNKAAQEHLDTIEKHQKAALAAIDKLDEHAAKDKGDHAAIGACCVDIHKELMAADEAAAKLQKELKLDKLPAPTK
jgi:hypothetical protein